MDRLLKKDLFLQFPSLVQAGGDPEWRTFADELNALRDAAVSQPLPDEISIETFGDFFDPEKMPGFLLDTIAQFFDVTFLDADTEPVRRRKILRAIRDGKLNGTNQGLVDAIYRDFGITIQIIPAPSIPVFDEAVATTLLPIQWGEDVASYPDGYMFWHESPAFGVTINLGDVSGLTVDQLNLIYAAIAADKAAEVVVAVIDNTGALLRYIFATDLSITSMPANADPGL